ncbi:hypothetical protein M0802_013629 [Mischocyttarus mexicanus]|nr:hypothetical protein M0802_013629 [Mischocyttarus mexicanus]
MVADAGEGLWEMFQELEKYSEKSGLRVNTQKTKYKYLGFWLNSRNSYGTHIRKMKNKAMKAINTIWGVWRRAALENLKGRLYLMEAVITAGAIYRADIWGWERWEDIERIQGRYVKMALEVNANTLEYIWGIEAGKVSLKLESKKRAEDYLMEILRIGDERWPKVCLKEEIRGIVNGYQSAWGQKLKKAFEEVGNGKGIRWMFEGRGLGEIRKKLEEGRVRREEQCMQRWWGRIDRSGFCRGYREWKIGLGCEDYWRNKLCGGGEETLEHIWVCRRAKEVIGGRWVEEIEGLGLVETEEGIRVRLVGLLKKELNVGMCEYSREFERRARENKKGERRLDLWGDW